MWRYRQLPAARPAAALNSMGEFIGPVPTALQGCQSSVDLIDRKSLRSTPTRICAHFASTLSFL
jgi:hypothetical protein